jgi:hypothetical protein
MLADIARSGDTGTSGGASMFGWLKKKALIRRRDPWQTVIRFVAPHR